MTSKKEHGSSIVGTILAVAAIAMIGVAGYLIYQHNQPQSAGAVGGTQTNTQSTGQPTNSTPTSVTYTSSKEHANFKYSSNWTVAKYSINSGKPSTDHIGLISPSGAITISYATDVAGLGNEHTDSYPYNVIIDKTAITGAPGLYVVSAITTLDSTTYYPWIAVQDSSGILTTGVQGDVATFSARHATGASANTLTTNLFATCGPRTTQNSPALSQVQATAWFSGAEAQQAKQILLSFTDAQ